jgi:hypothetical protein
MRTAVVTLFLALTMSSLAVGDGFTLAPLYSTTPTDPWPYSGMILWTSPSAGIVDISGDARTTQSTDDVWLQYIPASLAALGLNPGNVLQQGTTPVANGTVQSSDPNCNTTIQFGTQPCIPLRTPGVTLGNLQVQQGDVIAALIENYNIFTTDAAILDLSVQLADDFQQQGGSLANPRPVTGAYNGISGSLSHGSSEAYEFYWGGGDFGGTATTNSIFGTTLVPGGFSNGLELDIYSVLSGKLRGSKLVLNSSTASDSFDFGLLSAGNYVFQLTDMNSLDDPPFDIQFNGAIDPPSSSVPEPGSWLLLGTCLLGLGATIKRRFL